MSQSSVSLNGSRSMVYDPVDRLRWEKSGEGAEMLYSVPSTFGNSTSRSHNRGFGISDRFAPTGYEKFKGAPGPGTYRVPSAHSSKGPVIRPKSASASTDRVNFGPRGEGTGFIYQVPSDFEKLASTPKKGSTTFSSTTPRFSRTGYEKFDGAPGPGAYTTTSNSSSNNGTRRQSQQQQLQHTTRRDRDRLDFGPKGEGNDIFYSYRSSFERAASPSKSRTSTTPRFTPTGYEKFTGAPGPGAYNIPREIAKKSPERSRPTSAPLQRRSSGNFSAINDSRVDFGPKGEGAEFSYSYRSSFERAASPGKSVRTTPRFAPTGYEKFTGAPGPGTYVIPSEIGKAAKTGRWSPPKSAKENERLNFAPRESTELLYDYRSSFERAASPSKARTSTTPRFTPTGYEKFTGAPGPGAYQVSKQHLTKESPAPFGSTDRLGASSLNASRSSSVRGSSSSFNSSSMQRWARGHEI